MFCKVSIGVGHVCYQFARLSFITECTVQLDDFSSRPINNVLREGAIRRAAMFSKALKSYFIQLNFAIKLNYGDKKVLRFSHLPFIILICNLFLGQETERKPEKEI